MPSKPASPCRHPLCAAKAEPGSGWCLTHQRPARAAVEQADDRRGTAASRGYGSKWRDQSLAFRARHPICGGYLRAVMRCWSEDRARDYHGIREAAADGGKPATFLLREQGDFLATHPIYTAQNVGCGQGTEVTDHIIPHRGDQQLFWSTWNWQTLCKKCHDEKTAKHDGGFRGAKSNT